MKSSAVPKLLASSWLVSFVLLRAADPLPDAAAPSTETVLAVLTPKPPQLPRINGPKVFGVRPGSPFLYSIPATGERPIEFLVTELPEGLNLNSATGQITGVLKSPGEYKVNLRAKNAWGAAERPFRIVVGEAIALTPPLGWNSWNCWGRAVDQEKVSRSAHALIASGLNQHGWTYINIDDAWQGERSGQLTAIQPNKKFPDMKALCDEVHLLGLKVGIYSTPWTRSYAGHLGGSSENAEGKSDPTADSKAPKNKNILPYAVGKYSFAEPDARQWAEWGIDYLKYDWGPVDAVHAREMAAALRSTKRDIVLSLSNNAAKNIHDIVADLAPLAQAWRTTTDINDKWSSVCSIGFTQDSWAPYQSPGHYNDADMLVVGHVGWGQPHPTKLTPDEQYTHISLWCLLGSPLLIGCDLEKLDPFTISLLSNDEVLEIDQDSLCKQATRVGGEGDIYVYAKPLEDGSLAVGLFNRSETEAAVSAKWSDLKLTGKQRVRDLWRQQDLSVSSDEFRSSVSAHGAVLVRIFPAK